MANDKRKMQKNKWQAIKSREDANLVSNRIRTKNLRRKY